LDAIAAAPKADFYRRASEFARAFLDLDRQAFEIEV
jgi:TorA maturation chaperone TorD